eukprot:TRINITY_DN77818_c0_g1_i1.p1 TRINITY_DN77818_c0_g1~~TRINITY_DN77818_c0_g1_i1.p1  ORF type:complete len:270 (-),score=36.43 TRINITY_DN77818_c0_g1_i1:60-869(-)
MLTKLRHCAPITHVAFQAGIVVSGRKLLARKAATRSGLQCPRHFSSGSSSQPDKGADDRSNHRSQERQYEEPVETWGAKFLLVGALLRGAAMLPRFTAAAPMLRFAGAGPLAAGAMISVYEIGGWRLVLAIPGTVALGTGASLLMECKLEDKFKDEVLRCLKASNLDIPDHVVESLREVPVCQYETNLVKFVAEVLEDASCPSKRWRIEALGHRSAFPARWSLTSLNVATSKPDIASTSFDLPPQTRNWDAQVQRPQWVHTWQMPGLTT